MKRNIKFQYGFQSINGIITKVYSLSEIPNIKEKCDVWNVLPVVYVREFTGLLDLNNKEIYEGDILSTPNKGKGIVEWLECGFVLKLQNETVWTSLLFNVVCHYKIEGNIYETPYL